MRRTIVSVTAVGMLGWSAGPAWAHCDTLSGPVAADAREALETGRFDTAAIWVGPAQTDELRATFEQSLPVHRMGGEAGDLAERHFVEAAVRLHREAEGFPYTGVRPAQPLPPDVAAAERALDTGNLEPVRDLLVHELEGRLGELFADVRGARADKERSLEAGRAWADAYVEYITYVHGLLATIQAGPEHGIGEEE